MWIEFWRGEGAVRAALRVAGQSGGVGVHVREGGGNEEDAVLNLERMMERDVS